MIHHYNISDSMIFGRGKLNVIGKTAARFGRKALIVTGGSSSKKSGALDRLRNYLEDGGIRFELFDKAAPNPLTTTAEEGAKIAVEKECDMVIALGGGSVIDCAKAAAYLAVNEGDINDHIYDRIESRGALPIIAIPTTCGTGSEGNGFAVLTNPENGDKKSLRRKDIIPCTAIIDSELMETMPKSVLASVSFDALCHSMEAYLSKAGQPITDHYALQGMKIIADNLVNVYNGYNDPAAWDALAWASTLGGMVIHTAGVALPHGMEHPVSGLKNIVHGRGLAALTPVITEASAEYAPEQYEAISKILRGRTAADCADAIRKLLENIGLTVTLSVEGITAADIPGLTDNCFMVSAASIANHPKDFDRDMISKLYEKAL
ncbi:MAG: iron-containing alcohol dehydrogenase [Ruminococcus sp.]|nr:iron-containing alcohol dehydrogenase [Ruminococcus sp.]